MRSSNSYPARFSAEIYRTRRCVVTPAVNCNEFRDQINEYIDGELHLEQAALLEAHMKTCAECREEYEQLSAIRNMMLQTI